MSNAASNIQRRRIIFLDIDGVLVNLKSLKEGVDDSGYHRADEHCVNVLNDLTDATGAGIVISSTWRIKGEEKLTRILREWGVRGDILGMTPMLDEFTEGGAYVAATRGEEIARWREEVGHTGPFVILDDENDMGELVDHLIQTETRKGLLGITYPQLRRALELLGGGTIHLQPPISNVQDS